MKLLLNCVLLFLCAPQALTQPAQKILIVLTQFDDYVFAGPLSPHYAQQGVTVQLMVVAMSADPGRDRAPTGSKADSKSGAIYEDEIRCACHELGINAPITLHLDSDQGHEVQFPTKSYLSQAEDKLRTVLSREQPDAIITYGPEGISGDIERRLLGSMVSEIVQSGSDNVTNRLFFLAIPKIGASRWQGPEPLSAVENRYLSVRVPYSEADFVRFKRSLSCLKSQFLAQRIEAMPEELNNVWGGRIFLRPWFGTQKSDTILKSYGR